MLAVGIIVWVIILAWLVSILYPSQEMRRDAAGNAIYYSLWAIAFGSLVLFEYRLLALSGHAILAVASDLAGVSLGAARCWAMMRFRRTALQPGARVASSLHTHQQ